MQPSGDQVDSPRLSVIVPVYCHTKEHEQYLVEALESVAKQTFKDFELLIVDDVSPVDISPIVAAVQGLPETRIIRNVSNLRHAQSRNVGVNESRGELIAFLDHDDIWMPEKLERQIVALDANPDAAMVFCDMLIFGPGSHRLRMDQSIIPERPGFYWFVRNGNYTISASAVMVKKQAIADVGLFDSRYDTCDDIDAWLKILVDKPIVHMPEQLAKYRMHGLNVSYAGYSINDSKLLSALIWKYWQTASLKDKLRLLPRQGRKYIGRTYYRTLQLGEAVMRLVTKQPTKRLPG